MIEKQFFEIVREARDAYGSINKICMKTGVVPSTVSAYMREERCPSLSNAEYLLDQFGYEIVIKRKGWRNDNARN